MLPYIGGKLLLDDKTEGSAQPTSASPALPVGGVVWSEGTDTIIARLVGGLAVPNQHSSGM